MINRARSVFHKLPRSVRAAARRARAGDPLISRHDKTLSIIVPIHAPSLMASATHLAECVTTLQALSDQSYSRLRMYLVVVGEPAGDTATSIADDAASSAAMHDVTTMPELADLIRSDRRISVLSAPRAEDVAAVGLAAASRDYVILVRPGTRLAPTAIATLMRRWQKRDTDRLTALMMYDAPHYFADVPWSESGRDSFARNVFAGLMEQLRPELTDTILARLDVITRLALTSYLDDDAETFATTMVAINDLGPHLPTTVDPDGTVRLNAPELTHTELLTKRSVIGSSELGAEHSLTRIYVDQGKLHLTGWAFLRHLDLAQRATVVRVYLRPVSGSGDDIELTVRPRAEQVSRQVGSRWPDYEPSGFHATVSLDELTQSRGLGPLTPRGSWVLRISVKTAGQRADFSVKHTQPGSGAAHLIPAQLADETELTWQRDRRNRLRLTHSPQPGGQHRNPLRALASPTQVRIKAMDIVGAELHLTGRQTGLNAENSNGNTVLHLRCGDHHTSVALDTDSSGIFTATLPLTIEQFGASIALPYGTYDLTGISADRPIPVRASNGLTARLPLEDIGDLHRIRVTTVKHRKPAINKTLRVRLSTPLPLRTVGTFHQARLQRRYDAASVKPLTDTVLFQSYIGEHATDSGRAIHHELRRRFPHLELYWGVSNPSVPLPEGAIPVLINSREWYEIVTRASYLVNNVFFPRWWHKRPFQTSIQTWHGVPLKRICHSYWSAKGHNPAWIESYHRQSASWDLLLSNSDYTTEKFRDEFRFGGEILQAGFPRNDILTRYDVSRRDELARKVGIDPAKKIVMYAPTWRDRLSARNWQAEMVDYLDAATLARDLGDDYAVVLRGHGHNARAARSETGTARTPQNVINLTYYPEIGELGILADLLITDYSSLMCDFAVTGKPMVFFAPDLDEYAGAERGLYVDYEATVPGPVVTTPDGLAPAIMESLTPGWQPDEKYRAFVQRFASADDGHAAARVVDAVWGRGAVTPTDSASQLATDPTATDSPTSSGTGD